MEGLRVGYACVNTRLPTSARTLRLANATPDRLRELIAANLDALEAILRWNRAHGIPVFRPRLVLENDERRTLEDVLALGARIGTPVVFDAFHHTLAPSFADHGVREVVLWAGETWGPADARQEVHFSTQEPGRRPGAHSETLDVHEFARFVHEVGDLPLDCVLEVKDKERSALLAQELLATSPGARALRG